MLLLLETDFVGFALKRPEKDFLPAPNLISITELLLIKVSFSNVFEFFDKLIVFS